MKRSFYIAAVLLLSAFSASLQADSLSFPADTIELSKAKPKISIVVDDLGDNSIIANKIAALPAILTLAILPHTPHAQKISRIAINQGHEVIMHLPMEALSRPDLLGPGALFEIMGEQEFEQTLMESAQTVPDLVGFNNHMGSLLTQSPDKMNLLMKLAKKNNWYFLDSKTSELSVAQNIAEQIQLPTIGRDIFLDHHEDKSELPSVLQKQFEKLKKIAIKRGHVVVICHPYKETYAFLSQNLAELQQSFELVRLSDLMREKEVNGGLADSRTKVAKSNAQTETAIKDSDS